MNFLYFAYGVGILVAMVFTLFILTMLGSTFLSKEILERIIHPLFFIGLIFVGLRITAKASEHQYTHASLLALLLVTIMGMFVFVTGFVPKGFNLFLVFSFICFQIGIGLYILKQKYWITK